MTTWPFADCFTTAAGAHLDAVWFNYSSAPKGQLERYQQDWSMASYFMRAKSSEFTFGDATWHRERVAQLTNL